jgi:hypothetical protein
MPSKRTATEVENTSVLFAFLSMANRKIPLVTPMQANGMIRFAVPVISSAVPYSEGERRAV